MSGNSKRFFAAHSRSSAAFISIGLHIVLILAAFFFVTITVIHKGDAQFESKPVARPRMQLKKLQVPVKFKKKKIQPKLRKVIVSKPKTQFTEIKMPEISGIKGGLGALGEGGGLSGIGFNLDLDLVDLFGGSKGGGNELKGTFYDLKMKPDGSPAKMNEDYYYEAVRKFLTSWNESVFERYFQAPKNKFASTFMLPLMSADEAPKAYDVADIVNPKLWVAYYKGKIAAPESGRYRFWGIADDMLMVRVRRKMVIDASLHHWISEWNSTDELSRTYKMSGSQLVIGDWFSLSKGRPVEMEVLVGECPGEVFYCHLLIEQEGVDYPKGADGRPILPIFKTKEIPEELIPEMKIESGTCMTEGPVFGILK